MPATLSSVRSALSLAGQMHAIAQAVIEVQTLPSTPVVASQGRANLPRDVIAAQKAQILALLRDGPLTSRQIIGRTGLQQYVVSSRTDFLQEAGLIENTSARYVAGLWHLTEMGRRKS